MVVANATQTNGLAAHYTAVLAAQGWAMQTARDAATTEATSSVYYAAGQQAAAASIATTLGLKPAAVVPLTTAVPVTGVSGDDVVVVVGADLVPACHVIRRPPWVRCPRSFCPLAKDPGHSALCLDFDGTLSAIVADPGRGAAVAGRPGVAGPPGRPFRPGRRDLRAGRRTSSTTSWAPRPGSRSSASTAWARWVPTPGRGSR